MLAVGPIGILPSPLLAVVPQGSSPTVQPFTVVNGSVTWNGSGTLGTITATTNNSIVSWNTGAFNIGSGETFNFTLPNSGAILNKVGYNAAGSALAALPDNAVINGNLQSNGRVFVVANGDIIVGPGAQISTQGLFLSTLTETDNFNFSALGNLALTGTANGNITIGGVGTRANVVGALGAWGNVVALDNVSISGDVIVNAKSSAQPLALTGANGAVNVTGNLTATSNNVAINQNTTAANNLSVGGTATFNTTTNTAAISLTNPSNNFNVVTGNVGGLTVVDANSIVLGNLTVGTGGLSVTAANNITSNGTVAVAAGGATSLTSNTTGNIVIANNSTFGGSLAASATSGIVSINAASALTLGAVSTGGGGNLTVGSTGALTLTGAVSGTNVLLAGTSVSATAGSITALGGTGVTIQATNGSVVLPTITANQVAVSAPLGSISQLGTNIITTADGSTSTFTSSPTGTITLNNANVFGVATAALGGSMNLTGGTATINSTRSVAGGTFTIGDTNLSGSLTVNAVAAAANGRVQLGQGFGTSGSPLHIGGGLTITTNGGDVSDNDFTAYDIIGAVTINAVAGGAASANVELDTANAGAFLGGNFRTSMGQINIQAGTGNATVAETTTINLGTISAGRIQANSTTGDIIQSGVLTSTGARDQNRFAVSNNTTNRIILDNPANVFTTNGVYLPGGSVANSENFNGSVIVVGGNNNVVNATGNIRMDNRTNTSGGNLTLNATGNVILGGGTYRDLFINAADSVQISAREGQGGQSSARVTIVAGSANATSISNGGNWLTGNNNFVNNGTLTLTTPGGIQLVHPNNNLNIVNLQNVGGAAYVYSRTSFTVTGNNSTNVTVAAGTNNNTSTDIGGRFDITLGDINFGNLTAWALNGLTLSSGGNPTTATPGTFAVPLGFSGLSGNVIQQNATTSVHVQDVTTLITFGGDVRITNNNNSFGRVNAATGGGATLVGPTGNINITEYDTLRLGNILTNGTSTLTSRFGSIIEDPAGANLTVRGGLTLNAPNGSVLIGNASGNTTSVLGTANITAAGSASIFSAGNIVLGAIKANALTVTADNISQSAPLNIFGQSSFNAGRRLNTGASDPAFATTTGDIVLTDAANNFGPLVLTTVNNNRTISVTENNTLNLRTVTMTGGASNTTFTANSINGDIIDSGLGFVRLGGNVTNNVATTGAGVITLTAATGNIILDDPTTDIVSNGGIAFNAKNVTLSVLGTPGGTLALGAANTASAASGNLTVSSAQGNIGSTGNFTVGGIASFTTGLGNITLDQAGIRFNQLQFSGNQVRITEAGAMDLLSSSRASGPVQLVSGGGIVIVPVGTQIATFGSTVALQAAGDIVLRQMQALGTVSLSHTGTANLSALRLSDLLGSPQWVDLGSGPFVPPSQ